MKLDICTYPVDLVSLFSTLNSTDKSRKVRGHLQLSAIGKKVIIASEYFLGTTDLYGGHDFTLKEVNDF